MSNIYTKPLTKSSDMRRSNPERRLAGERLATIQLCRRYGVSPSHARVIANLQEYGRGCECLSQL